MFVVDFLVYVLEQIKDGFVSGAFFLYGGIFGFIGSVVGLLGLYVTPLDATVYTVEYIENFLEVRPMLTNLCFVGIAISVVFAACGLALMNRSEDGV